MMSREARARRTFPAIAAAVLFALTLLGTGCSDGPPDPAALLRQAEERAAAVAQSTTTLRMRESLAMQLGGAAGAFRQEAELIGAMQMPDRQRYEYRETWSGSQLDPSRAAAITLSYVTLDGGRTAYVKGSQLEERLGLMGWVYYTPAAGESRYFDYLKSVQAVTGNAGEAALLGEEEVNGAACWHLEVTPSVEAMLQEQIGSNPAFAEEYRKSLERQDAAQVRAEIWIAREGSFPVRLYTMMMLENTEVGEAIILTVRVDFDGYGEALLLPIDAPAAYTKVE